MRNSLFTALALLCITVGVIGIFLPLVPTTPFLLLATILLTKSRPALARRLINNRFIGVYIRSYVQGEPLPLRDKMRMIAIVVGVIALSIIYATDNLYMRLGLGVIALSVTVHIVMLRPRR